MDAMLLTDLLLYDRMCERREERAERYVTVSVGFFMDVVLLGVVSRGQPTFISWCSAPHDNWGHKELFSSGRDLS